MSKDREGRWPTPQEFVQEWDDLTPERRLETAANLIDAMSSEEWLRNEVERLRVSLNTMDHFADVAESCERKSNDFARRLAAVEAALAGHPECDVHPDGDPVTCGWKRAVIDIRAALRSS